MGLEQNHENSAIMPEISSPLQVEALGSLESTTSHNDKEDTAQNLLGSLELIDTANSNDDVGDSDESEEARYQPPIYHLRYDFVPDPMEEGIGNLLHNFDSISEKMAKLLDVPAISERSTIPLAGLAKILGNEELSENFNQSELSSMNLLFSQSYRLRADIEEDAGPYSGLSYSKETLLEAGEILGVVKNA